MKPIYVTKTFLPPLEEYTELLKEIWKTHVITNDGPLYQQFEEKLREYTGHKNLVCLVNGTIALQIAIRALELTGEVITTPFSHFASSSSLLWENCKPVFADIDPETLNIDPEKIEEKITKKTSAILAVHIYGNPCKIETIQRIAKKYHLKVIFDAAHALGAKYNGNSILGHGDISMASFNAIKVFNSAEGAALFLREQKMVKHVRKLAYYGINEKREIEQPLGTNAKMTELSAALGILNLKYFDKNLKALKKKYHLYLNLLKDNIHLKFQKLTGEINYSYIPVIFEGEDFKLKTMNALYKKGIYPREYFMPSLEEVYYPNNIKCPVAFDISRRVLCLPLSVYLQDEEVGKICDLINKIKL